jgi:hypothetical protein
MTPTRRVLKVEGANTVFARLYRRSIAQPRGGGFMPVTIKRRGGREGVEVPSRLDGSGHERHRDGSWISTATNSCQRLIRSVQNRTGPHFSFVAAVKTAPPSNPWQIGRRIAGGGHRHRPIYEIEAGDSWRRSAHRGICLRLLRTFGVGLHNLQCTRQTQAPLPFNLSESLSSIRSVMPQSDQAARPDGPDRGQTKFR